MAIAVIQEFAATTDQYDQVNEKLMESGGPGDGLIVHTGADLGGGRMKVVDIWESQDAYEKFVQERLAPAIAEAMGDEATQPDPPVIHELHDVVKP